MNGEARYNCVEAAQIGQRLVQVMLKDLNFISVMESFARGLQHGGREIERDPFHGWPVNPGQRQESAVSGSKIKNSAGRGQDKLEQDRLTFRAMRNPIGKR